MVLDFSVASFLWQVLLHGLALGVFTWACLAAHWHLIFEVSLRQHLLLGSGFGLLLFWLMDFSVTPYLTIHPLIITSVVLMVGLRFCFVVGGFATVAYCFISGLGIENSSGHFLINVALPASFIWLANRWLRAKNPSNLFFYTLGLGFLGSALTVPLIGLVGYATSFVIGLPILSNGVTLQFEWILLAMFPEAFINGVIVSSITVFYPDWMKTFDEEYFLSK